MSKTIVIHHSADFDGLFCREIARKFRPDAEPIGWDFGDGPLISHPDVNYIIMDLPCDKPFGFMHPPDDVFWKRVVWIDHHKSSIDSHDSTIPGCRIDGVAACRLAWQWFAQMGSTMLGMPPKEAFISRVVTEPLAVRLAGEYDIWDKRDLNAEVFQFGLRSRQLSDFDWSQMLSIEKPSIDDLESMIDIGMKDAMYPDGTIIPPVVHQLLGNGKLLQAYQQSNDAGVMGRSFLTQFEGLKFLCLNTPRCNSLTFSAKDISETGHDALMGFYWDGKAWKVSLYHARHNTGLDLSLIAVKYKGGGHRGACGFQVGNLPGVSELPFISS